MAVPSNLTKVANIDVTVRELEFVTQFERTWDALRKLMGIMRPIKKQLGTRLISYRTTVDLQNGTVAEGDEIPYSAANVEEVSYADIALKKYRKGVTLEAVNKYGAKIAVRKTDEELRNEITTEVLTSFYTFLKTGTLTATASNWQKALAKAKGLVLDKFNKMRKTVTEVVGFANVLDAYDYLGDATVSVQTNFGVSYIENFMGYKTLFLLSDPDIPQNTVIAVPVNNIDLYHIDPSDADIKALDLNYTVSGETNLIGYATKGVLERATGDVFAIIGMTLWSEFLDGIAVISISANPLESVTVTPESDATTLWGHTVSDLQSGITVSGDKITGTLKYCDSGALAHDWGAGNFIVLKWTDPDTTHGCDSLLVGLAPSEGSGLIECLSDTDRNGVFKVTDKYRQRFVIKQSGGGKVTTQTFDLSGLTCEKE